MGKSKKRTPAGTCCCCKSQNRGKQFCSRRFRRMEKVLISTGKYEFLTLFPRELTNQWDLGGDGKSYWGFVRDDERLPRFMRK